MSLSSLCEPSLKDCASHVFVLALAHDSSRVLLFTIPKLDANFKINFFHLFASVTCFVYLRAQVEG